MQNLLMNPLADTETSFIKYFCRQLLHHSELLFENNSEVRIVLKDMEIIKQELKKSNYYDRIDGREDRFGILNIKPISKQIRQYDFDMMQTMYNLKLAIFRTYQCKPEC